MRHLCWPLLIAALIACNSTGPKTWDPVYEPVADTPTTIELTERLAFPAAEGKERITPVPGVYRVAAGEQVLQLYLGDSKQPLTIRAKKGTYEGARVEEPRALLRTGEDPKAGHRAITMLYPDGSTWESLGSLEGKRPRGLFIRSYTSPTTTSFTSSWSLSVSAPTSGTIHWNRRNSIAVRWSFSGISASDIQQVTVSLKRSSTGRYSYSKSYPAIDARSGQGAGIVLNSALYYLDPGQYEVRVTAIQRGSLITRTAGRVVHLTGKPKRLSVGPYHTIALGNDGIADVPRDGNWIWVWGDNHSKQVDDTSTPFYDKPKCLDHRAVAVAAGHGWSLLILENRTAAILSANTITPIYTNDYGSKLSNVMDITVYAGRAYAVDTAGRLWSWNFARPIESIRPIVVATGKCALTKSHVIGTSGKRYRLNPADDAPEAVPEVDLSSTSIHAPDDWHAYLWPKYGYTTIARRRYETCMDRRRVVRRYAPGALWSKGGYEGHATILRPDLLRLFGAHTLAFDEDVGEISVSWPNHKQEIDIVSNPVVDIRQTTLKITMSAITASGDDSPFGKSGVYSVSSLGSASLRLTAIDAGWGRAVAFGWDGSKRDTPSVVTWGTKRYDWMNTPYQMWDVSSYQKSNLSDGEQVLAALLTQFKPVYVVVETVAGEEMVVVAKEKGTGMLPNAARSAAGFSLEPSVFHLKK